jgi:hypothetical protein
VPEPQTFRRKSSIGAVVIQFLEQHVEREDWTTRDISAGTKERWCQEASANQLSESNIVDCLTAALGRRHQLGHDTVSVGNQDRLATRDQADVFAQLVLENLQADGSHVADGSLWKLPSQSIEVWRLLAEGRPPLGSVTVTHAEKQRPDRTAPGNSAKSKECLRN